MTQGNRDKNRRLLVIDDNRAIHDDFRKILSPATATAAALEAEEGAVFGGAKDTARQTQFEVDSAYQGQEGVLLVQEALQARRPYAMAFVDVRMPPGMDGIETTLKLWELDPNLQVVICTAYSDYSWGEMFEKLGRRDGLLILKKPFDSVEALQLAQALTEKWWLHQQYQRNVEDLEGRVAKRTGELQESNLALQMKAAQHQRAEETLRASEAQLRVQTTALDAAANAIMITDQDGMIQSVNPAFTALTGYTALEAVGQNPRILKSGKQDESCYRNLWQTISSGQVWCGEMTNRRKDGSLYVEEMTITPLRNGNGVIARYIAIKQDITERKRLEAYSFQSQKMETVGRLAGGIAHEFNSIMTAIIGQSELVLSDLPAAHPLRTNAAQIHQAADRAATLTRQLLAYGRKQILQPEVLDLNSFLAEMESSLRHLAGRDVEVRIAPSAGPILVKADPGQIEQLIVNIVLNAADAMPHGGKLTLETGETVLDQKDLSQFHDLKAGGYVMLAITDTGAGMSEAVKTRIFEPFFTTKEIGQGTGLGLATCHGIIKQSGGHVSVSSEPGKGTTFKIYLPQVEPQAKTTLPAFAQNDLPRGTETILLAEEDPALRDLAANLMTRLGYTVLTAANGPAALNLRRPQEAGHIDLLFADVVMSDMDGKEWCDRLRALHPHIRILCASAWAWGGFAHQGASDPGVTLLQKPFTPGALAHKVREALDRKELGQPKPPPQPGQ